MPLQIVDEGHDNVVDVDAATMDQTGGTIRFRGSKNRVAIRAPFSAMNLQVEVSNESTLAIEGGCFAGCLIVYTRDRGCLTIGRGCSFNGTSRFLLHEPGRIDVGSDCLFGPDIDVVNSDMHSIVDVETGARLNPARDVTIGDRVWIGIKTFVAKGSAIGSGSVVGAYSLVSGTIPPQSLATGVPARVKREGVSWTFELI